MKNYIRNLIPLIALVFISLACQAQRKRVTASEFRSGWNHHISPRCFESERRTRSGFCLTHCDSRQQHQKNTKHWKRTELSLSETGKGNTKQYACS